MNRADRRRLKHAAKKKGTWRGDRNPRVAAPPSHALLERYDNHAPTRNMLRDIATERREWAGIPMPLDGESLVIEPSYPYAALGHRDTGRDMPDDEEDGELRHRRDRHGRAARFWSDSKSAWVIPIENTVTGKVCYGLKHRIHYLDYDLQTLGSSDAWGVEQEAEAMRTLASLVSHRQFKQYMLTGMFLETSRRSGVGYMFRRLKPTIALGMHGNRRRCTERVGDQLVVLAALCLHPIAYYAGSWAGAMCPTDDVIAHLMLMRGDEAMFWRRANQHPAWLPESGLGS